jgi:large subunit ribosomal protein L25
MQTISIEAKPRQTGKKNILQALRSEGMVPATFYHKGKDNLSLAVHRLAIRNLVYTTESHLVNLKFEDGTEKACILKDYQMDPVTGDFIHADFQGMSANEEVEMEVPLEFIGKAEGIIKGGKVQATLHKLKIKCLPSDLPENITVDITPMDVGHTIHVGELSDFIKGDVTYSILEDDQVPVISVMAPKGSADSEEDQEESLEEQTEE